jgi:type II secretory pathway predicted ATPase ExeA
VDWPQLGFTRQPFRPVIDTGSYFPAAGHEAALAAVRSAFARRDSFVVLEGAPGTGKSLVARLWLERLPAETPRILLANLQSPRPADLLQAILFDLSLPYQGLPEQELRLAVMEHLLGRAAAGLATVLVVDEAQNLGPAALEELRLLGNIESSAGSTLFTLLVGQPRLLDLLKSSECAAIAHRVGAKCRIEALTAEESTAYLAHQFREAGREPEEVIDPEAMSLLAESGSGMPRLLNRVAALAAELALQAETQTIDVEAALEAIERLGLNAESQSESALVLTHPGKSARKSKAKAATKKSA